MLHHCLEKDPRRRLRDIGDGRVALDHSSRAAASHQDETRPSWGRRSAVLALAAAAAAAVWLVRDPGVAAIDSLVVTVRPFNNLPGDQRDVAMSPKGDLIAYRQHGEKASEVWLADTKTARPEKLTEERDDLQLPVRSQGFNADGSEVWLAGGVDRRLRRVPACGRPEAPRFSWGHWPLTSPGHRRATESSITLAKPAIRSTWQTRDGENRRVIARADGEHHQHYQAWSRMSRWIYFVRGVQATYQWDLYRVAVDNKGGEPERLTYHNSEVGYPTPIDLRTILYVAKDQDGSGPWLWALDVEQKRPRRMIEGGLRHTHRWRRAPRPARWWPRRPSRPPVCGASRSSIGSSRSGRDVVSIAARQSSSLNHKGSYAAIWSGGAVLLVVSRGGGWIVACRTPFQRISGWRAG